MICYNNFTVNVAEFSLIFNFKNRNLADIQVAKKNSEGMRNIGAGNNSKVFFVKGKKTDKRKYENCQKNSS